MKNIKLKKLTLLYHISFLLHLVLDPTEICGCDSDSNSAADGPRTTVRPLSGYDNKSIRNSDKNTNNIHQL